MKPLYDNLQRNLVNMPPIHPLTTKPTVQVQRTLTVKTSIENHTKRSRHLFIQELRYLNQHR